ncbi:MAG: hypothetical protein U0744_17350 [Gemmataceae bacterium]
MRNFSHGTLYPDVIESGAAKLTARSRRRQRRRLLEELAFDLVEPLKDLFAG